MAINRIQQLGKKSRMIVNLHRSFRFYSGTPLRDLFDGEKSNLILTVKPYTMLSWRELSQLYEGAVRLEREHIEGAIVECGVCNGGSAGLLAAVVDSNPARQVWLFDSWEGLPEPTASDITFGGEKGEKGICPASESRVKELFFAKLHLNARKNHFVKGWFNETIAAWKEAIGKIALLHLDGDWYESVKLCLNELYDSVVEGGFIFIDDYGYWQGCRKAVDEFLEERSLEVRFNKIDATAVYFQKSTNRSLCKTHLIAHNGPDARPRC